VRSPDLLNDAIAATPLTYHTDAAVCRRSWTRNPASPAAAVAALQPTDLFQFDSRSGPWPGASNNQASGGLLALQRLTIGTRSTTSGTVRARLFFRVSTYSAPPPPLASTARQPQAKTGNRYLVTDLETSQLTPPQTG
jgi:hypothetical protein